jgi:hypothetical protein
MQLLFLGFSTAMCAFLGTVLLIGMVGSYQSGSLVFVENTPLFIIIAGVGVFMLALFFKSLYDMAFGSHGLLGKKYGRMG